MCMVSVVYDVFHQFPDSWYTQERIDLFRRMVSDAQFIDQESGQPDCFDPEKAKLEERIDDIEAQLVIHNEDE